MKIQHANEFVRKLGMGDPKTCVYQFIYNEKDSVYTEILQYFIQGLGLCIQESSFVAHMFYALSFSHNKSVPMAIKKTTYFLSLNTKTTVFDWGDRNPNKN